MGEEDVEAATRYIAGQLRAALDRCAGARLTVPAMNEIKSAAYHAVAREVEEFDSARDDKERARALLERLVVERIRVHEGRKLDDLAVECLHNEALDELRGAEASWLPVAFDVQVCVGRYVLVDAIRRYAEGPGQVTVFVVR